MSDTHAPILLTGVNGQVGSQLLPLLKCMGAVVAPTREQLDLTNQDAIRTMVRALRPRWIVNPAAYTAVDKAEKEPDLAFAINAIAPRVLGEEAAKLGSNVLHFSTDYVFDGRGTEPWREDDAVAPLGVYGASKLKGERELASSGAQHLIFRTSWVYGAAHNNFLRTILRLAGEREEIKIVADQHGAPTWARSLARLIVHTIKQSEAKAAMEKIELSDAIQPVSGTYHACDAGETTWFGFAEEFLRLAQQAEPGKRLARLVPITTADYPTPAQRPSNSRMNCEKLKNNLGFTMPNWRDSVGSVLSEIVAQSKA